MKTHARAFLTLNILSIGTVSTTVNGTVLNFGKRYKDVLRVIFDQSQKLHLGLDALSNQKILKGGRSKGFWVKGFRRPFDRSLGLARNHQQNDSLSSVEKKLMMIC